MEYICDTVPLIYHPMMLSEFIAGFKAGKTLLKSKEQTYRLQRHQSRGEAPDLGERDVSGARESTCEGVIPNRARSDEAGLDEPLAERVGHGL